MIEASTGESLFDLRKGNIKEGDLILVTAHSVRERKIDIKVNLEMQPCLDEDEVEG